MSSSFDAANTAPEEPEAIRERFRLRLLYEFREAALKRGHNGQAFDRGLKTLEAVVGTFIPDLAALKEADWVELITNSESLATKMVILKTHFPSLNAASLILKKPDIFLVEPDVLDNTCMQVLRLLKGAPDPSAIIGETPDLLEPAMIASAIVTFQRWWPDKDPLKVLQDEGGYWLRFAQENDLPLDPVYFDGHAWSVPAFDTEAKQPAWKKFIAEKNKADDARAKAERGFIF